MGNKITSGVWFVFIGLVLLLHNLNVIDFNFVATFKYWPLLIVIVGINLIVQNRAYSTYLKVSCNVLFLGWIFYVGMTAPRSEWTTSIFNNNVSLEHIKDKEPLNYNVNIPLDSPTVNEASLELNSGASAFNLSATTGTDLLVAKSAKKDVGLNVESKTKGNKTKVELTMNRSERTKNLGTVETSINKNVLWDMEINFGASNFTGDLSEIAFKKIELNGGASSINLTLGHPQVTVSKLEIAAGASKIDLRIPKETAVRLAYESVLSKTTLEGLPPIVDGETKTTGYDSAPNKLDISIEGAANKVQISRY